MFKNLISKIYSIIKKEEEVDDLLYEPPEEVETSTINSKDSFFEDEPTEDLPEELPDVVEIPENLLVRSLEVQDSAKQIQQQLGNYYIHFQNQMAPRITKLKELKEEMAIEKQRILEELIPEPHREEYIFSKEDSGQYCLLKKTQDKQDQE
jgi:hypothetical protein